MTDYNPNSVETPEEPNFVMKPAPEEEKKEEPKAEPSYGYSYEPSSQAEKAPEKKSKKKIWMQIGACVLAALVCFGAGFAGVKAGYANLEPVVIQQVAPTETKAPVTEITTVASTNAEQIAANVVPTVVAITTEKMKTNSFWGGSYVSGGAGSGVIISSDGYILTSGHVITGATSIMVELQDGTTYPASVVGNYIDGDIAVLKIEAMKLDAALIGDSDKLVQGATCYAVGNPEGNFSGSITEGIISALDRKISVSVEVEGNTSSYPSDMYSYFFGGGSSSATKTITLGVLQYSAAISPGNSGGGLFNAKGELVGIVCAKSGDTSAEGLSFAVPINKAFEIAQSLIATGTYGETPQENADANTNKAILGVRVTELSAEQAKNYGLNGAGVYVSQVTAKSTQEAGLKAYDRILSIDGTIINTYDDLKGFLAEKDVGDVVQVAVDRSGQMVTVSVKLIENTGN